MTGYYRTVDSLVESCIECHCNNLSMSCDTPSGDCDCIGNSTGSNCEMCISGYYGDPTKEIPCLKCDCNDRSISCNITGVCDMCDEGYSGDHCELCANGYHVC